MAPSPNDDCYKFTSKFTNEQTAINDLRNEIFSLLKAGSVGDLGSIRQIEISDMFKGKILSLYYPHRFLNVLSEDHVDHFLREFGLSINNAWTLMF